MTLAIQSTPPLDARATRSLAIAQYSADISKPMKWRPVSTAATAVVPLPMNGSSTVQPSGAISMSALTSSKGFWVECTRSPRTGAGTE